MGLPNTHSVGIRPGYHGSGSAYLGAAYGPFMAVGDPNSPNSTGPELTLPGDLNVDRLEDRRRLLKIFDLARREAWDAMDDVDQFNQQAFDMLTGEETRCAFDLSRESPQLRDRYGRYQWGQSALLARRLVEAGVRLVTLTCGGWDWHSSIEAGMQ